MWDIHRRCFSTTRSGDAAMADTRRHLLRVMRGFWLLVCSGAAPSVADERRREKMEINRNGSRPATKGPEAWFSGSVRVEPVFQVGDPMRVNAGSVTFEPGARTAWHTHPLGQTLIITAGL